LSIQTITILLSKRINKSLSKISKPLWNVVGSIFVGIGVIGIFLPLLPTTPFLLLAAYSYNRGSNKMREWIESNKTINTYITNYRDNKGMTLRAKMNSIFILWCSIGVSFYLISNMYIRLVLAVVLIMVTMHLISLPKVNDN